MVTAFLHRTVENPPFTTRLPSLRGSPNRDTGGRGHPRPVLQDTARIGGEGQNGGGPRATRYFKSNGRSWVVSGVIDTWSPLVRGLLYRPRNMSLGGPTPSGPSEADWGGGQRTETA